MPRPLLCVVIPILRAVLSFLGKLTAHAGDKIIQRGKHTTAFAFAHDGIDERSADIFERLQTKADTLALAVCVEASKASVDIGRENGNAAMVTFGNVLARFGNVAQHAGEQRRHVLTGMVRLEISGTVGDQRVGRGVRFR